MRARASPFPAGDRLVRAGLPSVGGATPHTRRINLIDLVIVVAAVVGAFNGYRRGLAASAAQYVGLLVGVVAGAALAPLLTDGLGITDARMRPLAAVLVLIASGSVGSSLGYAIGTAARRRLRTQPGRPEQALGAVTTVLAVFAVSWFLGLSFRSGPSPILAQLIDGSAVLRRVDALAPRPPAFLARVERTLSAAPFPQTFAGFEPVLPGTLPPPPSIDTQGVRDAAAQTWKVTGRGCGGLVTGSAFPINANHLVTNAHVVSGTTNTVVSRDDSRDVLSARVVLFDPEKDVAILYVPGARFTALPQAPADRGTQGAIIGYPGGGPETEGPAVVEAEIIAQGRDIYNQNEVSRHIWVVGGDVRPGNSGGPLVDLQGHVLGLIFAASSTHDNEAYALTDAEIQHDLAAGASGTTGLANSQYAGCAV